MKTLALRRPIQLTLAPPPPLPRWNDLPLEVRAEIIRLVAQLLAEHVDRQPVGRGDRGE